MSTTATQCEAGGKAASEASEVEKPAVATEVMAWFTASNQPMPARWKASVPSSVNSRYTPTMYLATMCERGSTFSDQSEDSVWNRRMPPTRSSGRIATAMAMKPMPPSHCSSERHSSRPGEASSRPVRTVPPVVVMPDMLSKKASV